MILTRSPSIPEILSAQLHCCHGESRIRDFQRQNKFFSDPGMQNLESQAACGLDES